MSTAEDLSSYSQQQNPTNLWLLVQYERPGGVLYEVIESSAVVQPKREKMHTGKTIDVCVGKLILKATIFIISDDRAFLETELRQLTNASETYNQTTGTTRKSIQYHADVSSKLDHANKKRKNNVSELSSLCSVNISNQSSSPWSNTSDYLRQSPNTGHIPPMTFDQQTQTDSKMYSFGDSSAVTSRQISLVLSNQEHMLLEQQNIKTECFNTKEQMQQLLDENKSLKILLEEVLKKVTKHEETVSIIDDNINLSNVVNKNENPVVLFTCQADSSKQSTQLVQLSSGQLDNVTIENIDINNDSNISYSNSFSQMSCASNSSMYNMVNQSIDINNSSDNPFNAKDDTKVRAAKNIKEMIKQDWSETSEIDAASPRDEVVIGNNQTTVPRYILEQIKWSSHTHATRKLLTTLFTREVLASHSLTGKPSPAFIDSGRPTKHQLDASIIADIIQCVSKRCGVSETAVRCSITTKCADENKMMRQRSSKAPRILQAVENTDRETSVREQSNKENV